MNLPMRPLKTNLCLLHIKIPKSFLLPRLPVGALPTLLSEGIKRFGLSTFDTEVQLCGLAFILQKDGDIISYVIGAISARNIF